MVVPRWSRRIAQSVFARQVAFTFGTRLISVPISVVAGVITARWLGTEGKGIVAVAMLVPAMLQFLLSGGLNAANVYCVGSGQLTVPEAAANSTMFALLGSVAGLAIAGIMLVTGILDEIVPGVPTDCLLIGLACLPFGLLTGYLQSILQGLRKILALNVVALSQSLLTLALIALLVIGLHAGAPGAILATLVVSVLTLGLTLLLVRTHWAALRPRWEPRVVRSTWAFGIKAHVGNVLQFLNYRLDVFLVNFFLEPAAVGIYSVSVALAELLWHLPDAVGTVIFPKAAASRREHMNRITPRIFLGTLGVCVLGAIPLIVFGQLAIRILFTEAFADAYVPMLWLLPGVVLLGGAKVLCNDLAGRGYPHYNSIVAGVGLIATVALDLLLIPRLGVAGAAIASSVSYAVVFVLAVALYLLVSKSCRDPMARDETQDDAQTEVPPACPVEL